MNNVVSDTSFAPGSQAVAPFGDDPSPGTDLRAPLRAIRRHKALVGSMVFIGVLLAFIALKSATPLYSAAATVLIEPQKGNSVGLEEVLSGVSSDAAAIASQVEILRSQSLLDRLIDDLDLLADPEFNAYRREKQPSLAERVGLSAILPASLLQAVGLAPDPDAVPPDPETMARIERAAVIAALLEAIAIEPVRSTYVISITATSADPEQAARLANALARLYILDQLEAKFEKTEQTNAFLGDRVLELSDQVIAAEKAVTDHRIASNLGDDGGQSLVEQQLNQVNAQLIVARADLAGVNAAYAQMNSLLSSGGVDSIAQVLENPLIIQLRQQESDARRNLAELSTRYGPLHPDIINAQAEIEDIGSTISSEVSKVIQNLANAVGVEQARVTNLESQVTELSGRFNAERGATVRLRELEREAEAIRALYETMLVRSKEVRAQEEIQEPDARQISRATVPLKPAWPKTNVTLVATVVISLVVGVGLALLIEQMRPGFRDLEHVESVLGMQGLVEVPLLPRSKRKTATLQVLKAPASPYSEAVRSIQTAIMLSNVHNPPKTVCLVSSVPEEGKSALAASLARLIVTGGRKVVLVDCDLRRPQQHKVIGAARAPGLTELLADRAAYEEVSKIDPETGLVVIPAGGSAPNPNDLLQSQRMKDFVTRLEGEFDLILFDTPAIMALADGLVVSSLADMCMMLVRWEKTPRSIALTAARSLRNSGARVAGVILSRVDQKKQARYGYSAYGDYHDRYGDYYKSLD